MGGVLGQFGVRAISALNHLSACRDEAASYHVVTLAARTQDAGRFYRIGALEMSRAAPNTPKKRFL